MHRHTEYATHTQHQHPHPPSDHPPDFNHLGISSLDSVVSNAPRDLTRTKPAPLLEPVPAQAQGYKPGHLPLVGQGVVFGELPHSDGSHGVLLLTEDCPGITHVGHIQVPEEDKCNDDRGPAPDLPVEPLDLLHLVWVPLGSIQGRQLLQATINAGKGGGGLLNSWMGLLISDEVMESCTSK